MLVRLIALFNRTMHSIALLHVGLYVTYLCNIYHHHHNSIYSARFTILANGALQLFIWSGNACKKREK